MGLYCWATRSVLLCCRKNDRRAQWPRYQKEAFEKNLQLVESVKQLADKKGCTPGQLALAWVHSQVGSLHCRVPGASP